MERNDLQAFLRQRIAANASVAVRLHGYRTHKAMRLSELQRDMDCYGDAATAMLVAALRAQGWQERPGWWVSPAPAPPPRPVAVRKGPADFGPPVQAHSAGPKVSADDGRLAYRQVADEVRAAAPALDAQAQARIVADACGTGLTQAQRDSVYRTALGYLEGKAAWDRLARQRPGNAPCAPLCSSQPESPPGVQLTLF